MAYSFGDNEQQLGDYAWYWDNAGRKTHPVGQKHSNAWGLYDMHGNVLEWVQDWYGAYTSAAMTDPTGAPLGSSRVIRGGSWFYGARSCQSASRLYADTGFRNGYFGFRLLRTAE